MLLLAGGGPHMLHSFFQSSLRFQASISEEQNGMFLVFLGEKALAFAVDCIEFSTRAIHFYWLTDHENVGAIGATSTD